MPKTFWISDLHFNHKNVLKYEPVRIDATLEYMTKVAKIQHNFTREDVLNDYNNAPEDQLILKDVLHYHNEKRIFLVRIRNSGNRCCFYTSHVVEWINFLVYLELLLSTCS